MSDVLTKAAKRFWFVIDEHAAVWKQKWDECDITIEGDIAKHNRDSFQYFPINANVYRWRRTTEHWSEGFTGEKYGGDTYWDTEAYCLPFYLGTAEQQVAKNLLIYRHKHLRRAIENAGKLGFKNGAALYPMVTMNGEECHNEWEITFEEIHRNGAIAYAIYDYIRYTGDESYLSSHGLDVLVGISRFWAQRVNFSKEKNKYVMLGVTGPNEYETTLTTTGIRITLHVGRWTIQFESLAKVKAGNVTDQSHRWKFIVERWWDRPLEKIADNIYLPEDKSRGVILRQDGFLDKDIMPVSQLAKEDRPLNQKWSWDRFFVLVSSSKPMYFRDCISLKMISIPTPSNATSILWTDDRSWIIVVTLCTRNSCVKARLWRESVWNVSAHFPSRSWWLQ